MHPAAFDHPLPLHPIRIVCALCAVALLACSQGEGETCQRPSDCDDGLTCVAVPDSPRSVCRSPEDVDGGPGPGDGGDPDLPADEDAGDDMAGEEDAGEAPQEPAPGDEDAGR